MPPAKLSVAVKAIIDNARGLYPDVEFTAEQAEAIWGGKTAAKLADLTDHQLLQYSLINIHATLQDLIEQINESAESKKLVLPNREARRKR